MRINYTFCYDYEKNSEEEMGQSEPNSEGGLNFRMSIIGNVSERIGMVS